jgi:hypothetical protein
MLLSTFGFLFLFYYLIVTNTFNSYQINRIFIALLCIVIISMLWMPLSLQYLTKKSTSLMYQILLVLLIVSLSALYIVFLIYNIKDSQHTTSKILALIGMIYFFIHAFFFDFITWSRNFF